MNTCMVSHLHARGVAKPLDTVLCFIPLVITLGKQEQKCYSMAALNTPSLMGACIYVKSYVIQHMHVSDQNSLKWSPQAVVSMVKF